MDTTELRKWIDAAGPAEVARLCGVGLDTVGRWATGAKIPATRHDAIRSAHEAWKRQQQETPQ